MTLPTSETRSDLKSLHNVILMIAKDFDAFCRANSITYYLMGGTALGAIRHRGFIPWDDDFDVFMDRKNYVRFLSLYNTKADIKKYYLQREDTPEWPLLFSKIRLNSTIYRESDNVGRQMHEGIFIDVMCLHGTSQIKPLRYIQYLAGRALSAFALASRGYETSSKRKNAILAVARMLNLRFVRRNLMRIVRFSGERETPMVGHFFGRAPFIATSFDRNVLSTPRYVPFEGAPLPVPHKVEEYLAIRFGPQYMDHPSDAVRASFPSHAVAFDLGPYTT